jgi:hypothetical protein
MISVGLFKFNMYTMAGNISATFALRGGDVATPPSSKIFFWWQQDFF